MIRRQIRFAMVGVAMAASLGVNANYYSFGGGYTLPPGMGGGYPVPPTVPDGYGYDFTSGFQPDPYDRWNGGFNPVAFDNERSGWSPQDPVPSITKNSVGIEELGEASVGVNGNAEYSYAIPLPKGINGFTPLLGVHYDSSSPQGLLGYGWHLSGLNSINRCKATYFADNYAGAIAANNKDRLCFNGMKLVHISGNYGSNLTEYRTLSDTYQKVILHNSMQDSDSWFEVWDKTGVRSEYRQTFTTDSGVPLSWQLTKKTDLAGNSIHYEYNTTLARNHGKPMLSHIDYSGFRVLLNYKNKLDSSVHYLAGKINVDRYRVGGIKVSKKDDSKSFLDLTFHYDDSTQKDKLDKVTIRRNSSPEITAFRVEWEGGGEHAFDDYKLSQKFNTSEYKNQQFADVDGDGFPDFIGFKNDGLHVSFGDRLGNYSAPKKVFGGMVSGYWEEKSIKVIGDVNGDGKSDIVGFNKDGTYVALSQGRTFSKETLWINDYSHSTNWEIKKHIRQLADVNGDGMQDIVGFGNSGVYVSLSTGSTFSKSEKWINDYGYEQGWKKKEKDVENVHIRSLADVNDDGLADVVGFSRTGTSVAISTGKSFIPYDKMEQFGKSQLDDWLALDDPNSRGDTPEVPRMFKDINGDGLSDAMVFSDQGIEVALSTGKGFADGERWLSDFGYDHGWKASAHLRMLSDLDGDGAADVVGFNGDGVNVALSKTNGFKDKSRWSSEYGYVSDLAAGFGPRRLTDINGDGQADIIGIRADGIYRAINQNRRPRVRTISTSMENSVSFVYDYLSNPEIYKPGSAAKYPQINVHTGIVVAQISRSNGVIGSNETVGYNEVHYKYEDKRHHLMGAGNLGFAKIHKWNKTLNRVESRSYHQDVENSLLYSALQEKTLCQLSDGDSFDFDSCNNLSSNKIEQTINQWETVTAMGTTSSLASTALGYKSPFVEHQRYKQQLINSTLKTWDLDGTLLKTVSVDKTYNKWYGHTLTEVTTTQDHIHGTTHTEKITNKYRAPNIDKWLVNQLSKKTVEVTGSHLYADDGTKNFIKTFDFEYNEQGLLTKSYEEKDTALERLTTYSDFNRGLAQTVTEYWSPELSKHIQKDDVDMNHRTTRYTYDKFGYTSSTTNALGQKTKSTIEPIFGNPLSVVGLDGNTTHYHYDDWGRELGVATPQGSWHIVSYQTSNDKEYAYYRVLSSNVDPKRVEYFDSKHRERRTETDILNGRSYTFKHYDAVGRIIVETMPKKLNQTTLKTSFDYDPLSRVKTVTKADGNVTQYSYHGFTTEVTNSENQTNTTVLNALGQKVEIRDDSNSRVTYDYDGWGNLTRTTDPKNNQIRITFNALGHRTQMIDPDLGTLTYKVNGLRKVYEFSNNSGAVTRDYYDLLGRKVKRIDPETPDGKKWTYNTKGQLKSAKQLGYYEGYTYYPNGQLKQKNFSLGGHYYRHKFYYDGNGRTHKVDYGENVVITYLYNNKKIMDQIYLSEYGSRSLGKRVWSLSEMDAFGNESKVILGNGLTNQYHYDEATGRIDTISIDKEKSGTVNPYLTQNFDFDSIGNLTFRQEEVNDNVGFGLSFHHFNTKLSEHIIYDNLNRISTVNTNVDYRSTYAPSNGVKGSSVSVDYDALGNITYKSDVGSYHYDGKRPHAVTSISGKTTTGFTYDNDGNQLSGMGRHITGYTSFNKPIEIRKGSSSTRFSYGVNQQRYLRKDVNDKGTTTTTYFDSTEIIKLPDGQTTYRFYIGDFVIYEKSTSGNTTEKGVKYLHKDHLGSPIAISDDRGRIRERFSFDAWGKRRETALGISINKTGRLGFTGHEMLDEVGLIHMNGRVYDPTLGRFLSADPFIQDDWFGTQAFNRYSYVQNNPLSYTDPTGMITETCENGESQADCVPEGSQLEDTEDESLAETHTKLNGFSYGNNSDFIKGYTSIKPDASFALKFFGFVAPCGTAIKAYKYGSPIAREAIRQVMKRYRDYQNSKTKDATKQIDDAATNKTTKEVLTRKSKGGDGGTSQQIIERDASGNVISRTHEVTTDGKTVHQHQNSIGKNGGVRQFPDEWTGTETIDAPYENIPPKFKPDKVPNGRTF